MINATVLVGYKAWADDVFYDAISVLTEKELSCPRKMLFGNILSLLNHVYSMDVVWRAHLENRPHGFETRNPEPALMLDGLWREQEKMNAWYQRYALGLAAHQWEERVQFNFIGRGQGEMSRGEIIQHVVNHGSYHRGHIEGVMYQLSLEPPTTDFSVFLRDRT